MSEEHKDVLQAILKTKLEKIDALCMQLDERDATIKQLQDKEILGDRRIVDLEHEKTVLRSETHDLGERLIAAEEENQRLKEALNLQDDYIKLLTEEIGSMLPVADTHGWRSTRHEAGKELRAKIENARKLIEP